MKPVKYFFFICLFFIACNKDDINPEPEPEPDIDYLDIPSVIRLINLQNMPRPADSYNYPLYPGMKKWETVPSGFRSTVLQIPVDILKKMSTQALIQAIWEYPYNPVIYANAYENVRYQSVFNSYFLNNNAYKELSGRADAGSELLYRLERINPFVPFGAALLELLVSQNVFVTKLNDNEKQKVIEIACQKDSLGQTVPENYGLLDKLICSLLIGRTLFAAGYVPFVKAVNDSEIYLFLYHDNFDYGPWNIYTWIDIPQYIINFGLQYLNE